jgi:hypothetical protein
MTKFIEITIEGQLHSINIDNIALIKQINEYITEIHLLSKNGDGSQIKFRVAYNYMYFRALFEDQDRLGFNFILNESK